MIFIGDIEQRVIDAYFLVIQESPDPKNVTLKVIAKRAGVNRQNIYKKHFTGVQDIINTIHSLIDADVETKLRDFVDSGKDDLIAYFAKEILPLLYEKREWLKILYGTVVDSKWVNFLQMKYTPIMRNYLDKVGNKTGLSDDFVCGLIVRQILAIIASWLTSENAEPPSLFQDKFITLISTSTYDLLMKG